MIKVGIVGDGRNSKMELKYRVYCLNYITQDIEAIINSNPLTYEEFCKRYKEENSK